MRLLHLFANFKLTGPAEPALGLASHLRQRGHDVLFAHMREPRPGTVQEGVAARAAAWGLAATDRFPLPKHFDARALWHDTRAIAHWIDAQGVEIVHCHLLNDHLTGALAVARSRRRPPLVRTNHEAVPLAGGLRNRFLVPARTAALIELSQRALEADRRRFGIPRDRLHRVEGAIELARFDPSRELPDLRRKLGLDSRHFVVGIAARIQPRRRFDVLLDAVARARREVPELRLVVIGRGTHQQTVAVRPARERGLAEMIHFPGYLRGDEYVGALRSLDVKAYLFPGTDGSCRAAREALALGRPVVASMLGMLPELVRDGVDGLLVPLDAGSLAAALVRLARDRALRARLGEAARRGALERFDPARQAARVEEIYRGLQPGG